MTMALVPAAGGAVTANQPPVAHSQEVSGVEDVPLPLALDVSDPDGDPLTITILTPPAHGTFDGTTYTPSPDYFGDDHFRYFASDGQSTTATVTVSINVEPVNDLPVAQPQSVTTDEDTPVGITLAAADVEHDPLTYQIVTPPAHGTFSGGLYTPAPDYHGSDSFVFAGVDREGPGPGATVEITINPVSDAPVAVAQSVTTDEDTPLAIALSGSDADGDPLTYAVATPPAHGAFDGTTYTPFANYHGADSFTFTASDGKLTSAPATIAIQVSSVNDAPLASAQSLSTNEDTPVAVGLFGSDVDGDDLTYSVATPPSHGTFDGATYTPDPNYHGSDSFTFTATDGTLTSAPASISIEVKSINDAPVAAAQSVTTDEDTPLAIALSGSDADGDPLTYAVATPPSHGTFDGTTYTPFANYHGSDSFTFTASDGTLTSAPATIAIAVQSINDAPVANAQSVATDEDTPLAIALSGSDADGDALTYSIVTPPAHGTFDGATYTPDANYHGPDSFTFTATDGHASSAPATVSIDIRSVNDAPAANAQELTVTRDVDADLVLTGSDADADALTFTIVTPPAHGTLTGSGAVRTYLPFGGYTGSDSFAFIATDVHGAVSAPAAVSILITPDEPPVGDPQSVSVTMGSAKAIVLTGRDPEERPLTFLVVAPPRHGTLSGTPPLLTYTPAPGYNGPDSFLFIAGDGASFSEPATVSIEVTGVKRRAVAPR